MSQLVKRADVTGIGTFLRSRQSSIAAVLPRHLSADRIIRVAMLSVSKNPTLASCSRESILSAIVESSQIGLEIGGTSAHAYLVPYKVRGQMIAQFVPGYRGLIWLVWDAHQIDVEAGVVRPGDRFVYQRGLTPQLEHCAASPVEDLDDVTHAWAVARFPDGRVRIEVMSKAEIDHVRKKSASQSGPWSTDYPEMARKTVTKRLIKYLPISSEKVSAAVDQDNRAEVGDFEIQEAPSQLDDIRAAASEGEKP